MSRSGGTVVLGVVVVSFGGATVVGGAPVDPVGSVVVGSVVVESGGSAVVGALVDSVVVEVSDDDGSATSGASDWHAVSATNVTARNTHRLIRLSFGTTIMTPIDDAGFPEFRVPRGVGDLGHCRWCGDFAEGTSVAAAARWALGHRAVTTPESLLTIDLESPHDPVRKPRH